MNKIALTALAAATAMAMAAPAAAQTYGRDWDRDGRIEGRWEGRHDRDRAFNINAMQEQLRDRMERGVSNGRLTRSEAADLRGQYSEIRRIEASYRRNGLNHYERRDLERRLVVFENNLNRQLRDRQYAYRR